MTTGLFYTPDNNQNSSPEYTNIQNMRNMLCFTKLTFIKKRLQSRIATRKSGRVKNIAMKFCSTLIYSPVQELNLTKTKLNLHSFSQADLKKIYEEFAKQTSNTIENADYSQIMISKDQNVINLIESYQSILQKSLSKTASLVPNSSFEHFYDTARKLNNPMIVKHFDQVIENNSLVFVPKTFIYSTLYYGLRYAQTYGPLYHVVKTLNSARLLQISGRTWFEANPFLIVSTPAVGAIALYSFATMVGCNSTLGKALTAAGDIMYLPMHFVEVVFNTYATPIFIKTVGAPILLNYTKTLKIGHGPGINYDDIKDYIGENRGVIDKFLDLLDKLKQSKLGDVILERIPEIKDI
jgi:hypothetical protein